MKANKLLILLAAFSMCITGCNLNRKDNKTSSDYTSQSGHSSSKKSSEEEVPPEPSSSEPDLPPEPSSSSEPEEPEIPEPGDPLTPPSGRVGFPVTEITAFCEANQITDLVIPEIANNQAWSCKSYTYFPILKIWTLETTGGIAYEDQYCSLYQDAGETVSNAYYDRVGYSILGEYSIPKVVFKTHGDYFIIYINAKAYDLQETADGCYPYEPLDEYFDMMNVENTPPFPMLELEEHSWQYKNYFYTERKEWRLFARYPDPNSPDNSGVTEPALEELYKDLLEANGWEVDSSTYDYDGYHATKEWVGIQFFSWQNYLSVWVFKK